MAEHHLAETLWEAYLYITGKNVHYGELVSESNRDSSVENKTFRRDANSGAGVVVKNGDDIYNSRYISPFEPDCS